MLFIFSQFVQALRRADVAVSPMETLDALQVIECIGLRDPILWRDALALSLAKSQSEKRIFAETFERFFAQGSLTEPPHTSVLSGLDRNQLVESVAQLDPAAGLIADMVVRNDDARFIQRIRARGLDAAQDMTSLRDKRLLLRTLLRDLGVDSMHAADRNLRATAPDLAAGIGYVAQYVEEQAQAFVDLQYAIIRDPSGDKAIRHTATAGEIRSISPAYDGELNRLIEQLAQRLLRKHRDRKRTQASHRALDLRKMLRRSLAYDGHLMELSWQHKRLRPNKLFVLCDVSGSMARVARSFALLMLHLQSSLPRMRTFAFSNTLGEVTQALDCGRGLAARGAAIEQTLSAWGGGNTDYGAAFAEFSRLTGIEIDKRSTVIVLGDARCNQYDPRVHVFKKIAQRSRRVIWLNPEPREAWGSGDSEMHRYAAHCLYTQRVSRLDDLRRFADRLLTLNR